MQKKLTFFQAISISDENSKTIQVISETSAFAQAVFSL